MAMLEQVFGRNVASRPTLAPRRLLPVPPAEEVQPVPAQYITLVGPHAPHPGTGLGYRGSKAYDPDLTPTALGLGDIT